METRRGSVMIGAGCRLETFVEPADAASCGISPSAYKARLAQPARMRRG